LPPLRFADPQLRGAAFAAGREPSQSLNEFGIALGTLDDDPGVRPESHIFVGSKAPGFEITDELPQYPGYPPAG
jgi:hypothetical protein